MKIINRLRRSNVLAAAHRRMRDLVHGRGWGGFHHDAIYRGLMLDLGKGFPFTSFVETGTYRGYSTELMAIHHPGLPIFTAETFEPSYKLAKRALKKYRNVTQFLGSSDQVLGELLQQGRVGTNPLFFLDAHWEHYWPLRAELAHIAASRLPAVIVIDDFEVPDQPQFEFDIDGGGELVAGERCNLNYIRGSLTSDNVYNVMFPKYSRVDAFGSSSSSAPLRGHLVLFQNMTEGYEAYCRRPYAQAHYDGRGLFRPESPAEQQPVASRPGSPGVASQSDRGGVLPAID